MCSGDHDSRATYTDTVAGEKTRECRSVKQSTKRALFLLLAHVCGIQVAL